MHAGLSKSDIAEKAAASLSKLERDVLSLSAHVGLCNGEIAGLLGISERRVERVLARALRKFDRALQSMAE
jgi:DNA-directed RNA polymerase specialized sigma24 family protein